MPSRRPSRLDTWPSPEAPVHGAAALSPLETTFAILSNPTTLVDAHEAHAEFRPGSVQDTSALPHR